MTKKEFLTVIAFILFILGFTSITLSLVGIRWSFLAWLDQIGVVFGTAIKVLMILAGIIILYLAQSSEFDSPDR